MNTGLLSSDINEITGIVNIIPYQINQSGKYPFLQYFLLKYTNQVEQEYSLEKEEKEEKEVVSFLKFDNKKFMDIFETCAAALDILFLSYEELEPKYKYKGHLFYNNEYYMFFDCSEYQMLTHNLNKQNDIWLTLVDEIVNYKMVCQFKIDNKVSQFFLNHPQFIKLQIPESNQYYESPIVAYIGCNVKKRDFLATFGQIPNNSDSFYHFTSFNDVYLDTDSKRSGLIRFAIFAGNMRVLNEINENKNIVAVDEKEDEKEDMDWTIYDSIYLDKTWIIKKYDQQVILTSHLRENDKLYII